MKRLSALLLCAVLVLCLAPAAAAVSLEDPGYTITDYAVQATVHADGSVTHNETIAVNFTQPRHGLVRGIPVSVRLPKEAGGETQQMAYRAEITEFRASENAELSTENGYRIVRLGDEDVEVTGPHTYTLQFHYDLGADRVPDYDELFHGILGTDWDVSVQHFSYAVSFETPLPDEAALEVFSGAFGTTDNSAGVTLAWDGGTAYGESTRPLAAGEGISLYARLPEGFWTNVRQPLTWPAWALCAAAAALAVITVLAACAASRRLPATGPQTAPPDGISSAEVGYIIDGSADDSDLLSLVLWFADQGYLTLSGSEDHLVLRRRHALPLTAPDYQRTLYDALFPDGAATCDTEEWQPEFYQALQQAKAELAGTFQGERALHKKGSVFSAIALPVLAACLLTGGAMFCGALLTGGSTALGLFTGLPLVFTALLAYFAHRRWLFAKTGERTGWAVGIGLTALTGAVCAFFTARLALVPFALPLLAFAAVLAACLLAPRIDQPTAYARRVTAELLGLRETLLEEQQAQAALGGEGVFYRLLPYAYVFGLAEHWAKRFDKLAPPAWWSGEGELDYTPYWMCGLVCRRFDHSMTQLHTRVGESQSSSSGGFSSSSTSGFSGGGMVGGGGSSW